MILGNSEESGFPLAAFLAIVILNELIRLLPAKRVPADYFQFSVVLWGAVLIAGSLFSGALGTSAALAGRLYIPHRVPPLRSPILSGFVPAGDDFMYGELVNDDLSLVEKFRRPGDTIMALDFSNPFSYGFGMKPAPGGATVLQYKTTFDDRFRPSAGFLFGSARLVAVPKVFSDGSLDLSIPRLYGPYLKTHFNLIGDSKLWRLYRRNDR